jgi:hypothetical protein
MPLALIVWPITASAQIVKRWPGAKKACASPSASATLTTARTPGRTGSSLSHEIRAGKYSW